MIHPNWFLIYFFNHLLLRYLYQNSYSQPISYKLGIPSSALLFVYVFQIPINMGKFQPHGNIEPGAATNADTGWVIHIHPVASVPSCYGESTSKALGCFWYLCHFQKMLHSPCTPCTHTEKKKKTNLKALHNYGYRNHFWGTVKMTNIFFLA